MTKDSSHTILEINKLKSFISYLVISVMIIISFMYFQCAEFQIWFWLDSSWGFFNSCLPILLINCFYFGLRIPIRLSFFRLIMLVRHKITKLDICRVHFSFTILFCSPVIVLRRHLVKSPIVMSHLVFIIWNPRKVRSSMCLSPFRFTYFRWVKFDLTAQK